MGRVRRWCPEVKSASLVERATYHPPRAHGEKTV